MADGEGIAQGELVLGQGPGLVRAEHVHAGQLLDGHQPADDGLLRGEHPGTDGHRHRQHRRHRHGDGGHGEDEGELQGGEERVTADGGDDDDHHDHGHRQDDQERADLEDGPLEVADGLGFLDELRGLAEVGVRTRGVDECADLALADDGGGEHRIAGLAAGGQRLPGQCRLIHFDRVAVQQACVCGHDVTQAQADDVSRNELTRWWSDPLAVPFDTGLDRQLGLQGGDGLARLALFPEPDAGVGQEQDEDDEEVGPVLEHSGQDHRRLDHPGDGPPEVGEELQQRVDLLLRDLVRAVLGQALLRLDLGEAIRGRPEPLLDLGDGKGLQVVARIGLRAGSLVFGAVGPRCRRSAAVKESGQPCTTGFRRRTPGVQGRRAGPRLTFHWVSMLFPPNHYLPNLHGARGLHISTCVPAGHTRTRRGKAQFL